MLPILIALAVVFSQFAISAPKVIRGTDPDTYVLTGTFVTPDRIIKGKLVMQGDTIQCIGSKCATPPGATRIELKDSYVYPGFIDAHQHLGSNISPLWKNSHIYQDRYEWQKDPDHLAFMAPERAAFTKDEATACAILKYAELRELVSGVTTVQGVGQVRPCLEGLVRNADGAHQLPLPPNRVVGYIPDVRLFNLNIDWNVTKCLAIHLGEGIDEYARQELSVLDEKGLLRPETMIIHATAFGPPEFARIAKVGAKVVWSPQSNIALYGKSMNVEAAIRSGIEVSLGVDWSPSGSSNILEELRVADRVNSSQMHHVVQSDQWTSMITARPARALSLGEYIGSLQVGKKADISILKRRAKNPNASLLKSEMRDVEMVWIGGRLLYGDTAAVEQIRPAACELVEVGDVSKRLCVADSASKVPGATQTFAEIDKLIRAVYPNPIALAQ